MVALNRIIRAYHNHYWLRHEVPLTAIFDRNTILEPFPFRLNRNGALDSRFDAFS